MIRLHVNIDHIATLRQARQIQEPDPVTGALMAELAGARGITAHLREDRRHMQDHDIRRLRDSVQTRLNLEMAPTEEMFQIALSLKPDMVTLVPEKREEVTTEGGLDVVGQQARLKEAISSLKEANIRTSCFIDPDAKQIEASHEVGAEDIELHTGTYANHFYEAKGAEELLRLQEAAHIAHAHQLQVNAGHGLNYYNIEPICKLPHLVELNIGHSIISRSIFVGLPQAVKEMLALIQNSYSLTEAS